MTNDIIKTIDHRQDVVLVLLDLSVALDTIYHTILVGRLESYFGFSKLALCWFKSYLENRRQLIVIGDQVSTPYAQRKSLFLVNICAANLPDQIEPSKVFCLPFNAHPEGKFPICFFITSKVIDAMS